MASGSVGLNDITKMLIQTQIYFEMTELDEFTNVQMRLRKKGSTFQKFVAHTLRGEKGLYGT